MNKEKPQAGQEWERGFDIVRSAIDVEARTVELAFSSETPYERFFGIEILDHSKKAVRLNRLKGKAALLVEHDGHDHVGVIESVHIDPDLIGRAVVRFGKSARAEEIFQDVQDGIRNHVSVRYKIHKIKVESVDEKTGVETYRVTEWEPFEISIVSVPADATVGIGRSAEPEKLVLKKETQVMDDKERQQIKDDAKRDAEVASQLEAKRVAEIETKRTSEILEVGEKFGQLELAAKAVKDGVSIEAFQRQVLEAKQVQKPATKIDYGAGARTTEEIEEDGKLGFKNLGEFAKSIVRACTGKGSDEKLTRAAATTYASENVGEDGAYVIPPEFSTNISTLALSEESLLPRVDQTPVSGNSMTFHKDESTPWQANGVQAKWEGEAAMIAQSKPGNLERSNLLLKKLTVLVPASDELLADAIAMSSHIQKMMGIAVDWKTQDAIVNGTGAGQPLGFTKGAAFVTQAKEGSQAADTVVPLNLIKMFSRVLSGAGSNIAWLMNRDVFPQIVTLNMNNTMLWTPAVSGFKEAPNGFLLGRPMLFSETVETLGDANDIMLCNFNGYRAITKAGGAEFATSMHLWFDQGLQAFRLTFRMDGQPTLSNVVTPNKGSFTRGHFIGLAARA